MNVDGVTNGIVLDHIRAGKSMLIYQLLHLDELDCCIAIIKNVQSTKLGRKDIIKIDADIDLNLEVLGYIDPNVTVNLIRDGRLYQKKHLALPERLTNILRCRNPRCISSTEPELDQVFVLADREKKRYRCLYCETRSEEHRP